MVPAYLEQSLTVLRKAFPSGVADDDYLPLLAVLFDEFSEENLGIVVAELVDGERVVVANDAVKAATTHRPSEATIERMRQRLDAAGWEWEFPGGF